MKPLDGKVAVVTGAASGLGRAMADRFATEGMTAVVADIRAADAEETAAVISGKGGRAVAMEVDVTDRGSLDALAARVEDELGGTDVLVNNAGVVSHTPLAEPDDEGWRWIVDVNLLGVVFGIQAFLPRMVASGREGHIVNVSSVAGIIGGGAVQGNRIERGPADPARVGSMHGYLATKYAVVGLSEGLSSELRGSRIGVSVLCPSHHEDTGIFDNSARHRPEAAGGAMSESEVQATVGEVDRLRDAAYKVPRAKRYAGECAERVVHAITNDHFYVLTHPETRAAVEDRYAQLLTGYDDAVAFRP